MSGSALFRYLLSTGAVTCVVILGYSGRADVAWRWAFWHQSRFAADYRRLFGELPSETPRRQAS